MRRRARDNDQSSTRLEICPVCAKDFVQPISWEPEGEERWWMFLRCGECGMSREVIVTNVQADAFERALHARATVVSKALRRLEGERFEAEIVAFTEALNQDLIDADSFVR